MMRFLNCVSDIFSCCFENIDELESEPKPRPLVLAPVPVAANFQLPDNYQLKYEAPQTRYSGPDEVDEEDTQKCPYRIELRPKTSHEDSFDLNTVAIGNFSQILSVQRRSDNEPFVLKAMNRVSETTYEVDILRDLDHLNILKLVDCYIFDQRCQLVLEKCTCSAVQYKDKYNTAQTMFNLIGSALDGLVYLHKQKIIHMNIRASNLLIVEKPNNLPCLKISDFALAQREPFRVRSRGPVQWLSPEMIRGHFAASCYSSGCDIWSFGITLLEIFQGAVPNAEESADEFIERVLDSTFEPPKLEMSPDSWEQIYFAKFVEEVLIVKRCERFSAQQLLRLLAKILLDYRAKTFNEE